MVGGAALIDKPDSEPSRPEGLAGPEGGGVTAESCTWRKELKINSLKWQLTKRQDYVSGAALTLSLCSCSAAYKHSPGTSVDTLIADTH